MYFLQYTTYSCYDIKKTKFIDDCNTSDSIISIIIYIIAIFISNFIGIYFD